MKISNKEIALTIHKTPSAISYLKKNNNEEFNIVKLGVLCKKLNLTPEDLLALSAFRKNHLERVAS
jgi:DNA-binding Xre family transcriptional regulator